MRRRRRRRRKRTALGFDGCASEARDRGAELQLGAESSSPVGAGWGSGAAAFYRFGMKNVFN